MSTAFAHDYRPVRPVEDAEQPRMRALASPRPRKRPKLVYGVTVILGIALIAIGQISLSLAITQDSFTLATLRVEQRELGLQVNAIESHVAALNSPQNVAVRAESLGLVAATAPAYLRLSDGKLFGTGMSALLGTTSSAVVSNALIDGVPAGAVSGGAATESASLGQNVARNTTTLTPIATIPTAPQTITGGLPSPQTH